MRIICCFLLVVFYLAAEEDSQVVREANAYFEAREFDHAYDLYKILSQGKAAPWQKERIAYNLGTILLAEGKYEQALEQYSRIPYLEKGAPYLTRAVQTNLAILYYRKAAVVKNQPEAVLYLRNALNHIDKAQAAECELEGIKNRSNCRAEPDLKELRGAVKNQLAMALDQSRKSMIADASLKAGMPFLISEARLAESHLDFLEILGKSHPMFGQYLRLFSKDLRSWDILWDSLEQKLKALGRPRSQFQKGVQLMEQGEFKESRSAFLEAESQLSSLMQKIWGNDSFKKTLSDLLTSYQYALDQIPIQPAALYPLAARQEQLTDLLNDGKPLHEYAEYSGKQLKASLEFARAGQHILSRYYLEEARQWIKRALRESTGQPDDTLEAAIEDQQHALILNQLLRRLGKGNEDLSTLLKGAQRFTLKTAEPFIQEALKMEKANWPKVCQCKPWDLVIPLFAKGEEAARLAEGLLEQDTTNLAAARLQEKALEYWKQALLRMRRPDQSQKEKEEQKPETSQKSPPAEESKPMRSINEVQRALQLMYQDDRQLRPSQQPIQKGMRPW